MTSVFGSSFGVFVGLAGLLFGFAAFLTGQAIADTWRPVGQAVASALGLALAVRFLDFSLFGGPLLSLPAFLMAWAWLAAVAWFAWRVTLAHNMVRQYPWLYEPAGPFGWKPRQKSS
jgi:hypothetical protein